MRVTILVLAGNSALFRFLRSCVPYSCHPFLCALAVENISVELLNAANQSGAATLLVGMLIGDN